MYKEIFLFINPLNEKSLEFEKKVMSKIDISKTHIRFIPIINLRIVHNYLKYHPNIHNLNEKNKIFQAVYDEILAFNAAAFQGAKKARNFLMNVQEKIFFKNKKLSSEIIIESAYEVNLDIKLFKKDWHSNLAKKSFLNDLQLANEMHIRQTSITAVE